MKWKIQHYFLLSIGTLTLIGLVSGQLHIEMGATTKTSTPMSADAADIADSLRQLRPISGQLLIFPGAAEQMYTLLATTQRQLQIQTYDITENRITLLFQNLLTQGVNIQLIMEDHKYQQHQDSFQTIQTLFSGQSNFAIKSDKQMHTEYVHSKIDLMDSGFLIKTANFNHSSLYSNREYMFASQDSGILQSLQTIFHKDRAGEPLLPTDIAPNLLVCNINCRGVIEYILSGAKESIIIQTQYITDPAIIDILSSKRRLSEMKLLVSDTSSNDMLLKFFPEYARKLPKPYLHAKMILIDHQLLLLGSMNLSANSLDKNREIGILLTDPELIARFVGQFTKDWNK